MTTPDYDFACSARVEPTLNVMGYCKYLVASLYGPFDTGAKA